MVIVLVSLAIGFFGEPLLSSKLPLLHLTFRGFIKLVTYVVVGANSVKSGLRIGVNFWLENSVLIMTTTGIYLLFALFSNLPVVLYQEKYLVYLSGFMLARIIVVSPD